MAEHEADARKNVLVSAKPRDQLIGKNRKPLKAKNGKKSVEDIFRTVKTSQSMKDLRALQEENDDISVESCQSSCTTNTSTLFVYSSRLAHQAENGLSLSHHDSDDWSDDDLSCDSPSRTDYSLGDSSTASVTSRRTAREMINDIRLHSERNQPPPEYVRRMDELSPQLLTWNSKLPALYNKKSPPINILGCHQPIELILAKADKRFRRRKRIMASKRVKMEQKIKQIDQGIKEKFSRAERYATIFENKQRQMAWLKLIPMLMYMKELGDEFSKKNLLQQRSAQFLHKALIVKKCICNWFYKKKVDKYELRFRRALKKCMFVFVLHLRIARKRWGVKILHKNLMEIRTNSTSKLRTAIHRFAVAVRLVQGAARSFMNCKHAKIEVLSKLWTKMEVKYLRKMLLKRGNSRKKNMNDKAKEANSINFELFSDKDRIEMKKQAKLWLEIDKRCDLKIADLTMRSILTKETEDEQIQKLMISKEARENILRTLLATLRTEYFLGQKQVVVKKTSKDDVGFRTDHALALLRGDSSEELDKKILEKLDKRLVSLKYKPFYVFSCISNKQIYDMVKEVHRDLQTFKINIETNMKVGVEEVIVDTDTRHLQSHNHDKKKHGSKKLEHGGAQSESDLLILGMTMDKVLRKAGLDARAHT